MEAVNGVEDKGAPPPPSPLTGCYLLIVIGEPQCNEHKDIILQRVAKGLLSWDVNDCLVDLEKELAIITEQALEGEEARYGERLIQFASENLVTEILIHPVVSTLAQCVRNLLSSFTRHRHIIHAGYTFANNGSWVLQDGTFSLADFSEAFQEIEVLRVIRAYENGISLDIHCAPEGDWTRLPKEPFTKSCKVRVNPNDVLTAGTPSITNFINYLEPFLIPAELENILESSDVVGNIRFSRPTLYVFPGGQGDAALFGINGFNMLLDGGFSRKACFWDFVRHLDRLDAVLLTRLNNSNVNGISAVLRRKRQNAVYPQIGHFFCNIQERKAILSPDGDKDKDPLLINLLDEGQEIVSNLRHLSLTPQVCYRDSEPINLYHKVGHGTLDMYVLSPAKDSKEVREFLQKWNNNDQKLFANQKTNKDFVFPLQNLVSICALLVWQPANPEDTITRILFPGSSPQNKIFEGLDRIKSLEFIKHPVCSEKSLAPTTILKTKQTMLEKIMQPERKIADNKKEKPSKPPTDNIEVEMKNGEVNGVQPEKIAPVKKSDSTESEKSISKPKKIIENGDKTERPKPKSKSEAKTKPRSDSQQRKVKSADKKPSPTTPKKSVEKINGDPKQKPKASPTATPAKSTKEANNRKVVESKIKAAPKKEPPKAPVEKKEAKAERKPISRRPKDISKLAGSPSKKVNGVQKPDSISRRGKLDKEGTTDSSTVSTPSADQDSILKKDISKLTTDELQNLKAQELADLKEEQEAVKEIEAVFRKGELQEDKPSDFRKIKDISIDDKLENEEYLIIEKTEMEQDLANESNKEEETQKIARDSEESEKQRKLSGDPPSKESKIDDKQIEIQDEVQKIITSATDIVKAKDEVVEASKEVSVTSPEDKIDVSTDKKDNENEMKEVAQESQPDEKGSANIESGATTTAPTLPEDERMPLDEIKEDNGDQVIEEKHVKEDTKEKDVPVIQLPPKTFDNIAKLPPVVGIRLDKQSHIRDIVKTPDEVADLPVHEEVEFDHYDEYPTSTETKTEPEEAKKDDKEEKTEETKLQDAKVEKVDKVVKAEDKVKTEVENKQEVIGEKESKTEDKEHKAVISEDLNKKELSKSPDEEKDTDEHELELQKEDSKQSKPVPPEATKAEQDVIKATEQTAELKKEEQIEVNAYQEKEEKAELNADETKKEETTAEVKLDESFIKKKSTEPTEADKKKTEIKKNEEIEKSEEASKEQLPTQDHLKTKDVVEKSETEVKEKDDLKPKETNVDKEKEKTIENDTGEEVPEINKEEPKIKLKEDVNTIHKIDEKLQKLKEDVVEITETEPKKPTEEFTQSGKEQVHLVKEDVSTIKKIDEKLQKLKEEAEEEPIKAVSEIITHKVEEPQHAEPVIITTDSNPESPMIDDRRFDDKLDLGRKSPKEREEDVAKIVASVAEVLKSDAPLEEFEGKIPFNIPYKSYTTELRETHITTVESPVTDEGKTIKSAEEVCPKATSTYFLEEERKIAPIHEEQEVPESKISKMMKESNELMQATSRMIQDIKQTQPITEDIIEEEDIKDDQEVDAGTVHRMLVTASSEDGGEEIEICPAGTITFSRSSESSGRSSPDPQSQKLSQKSSIADTFSDATVITKSIAKDLGTGVEEIAKPLDESKKDVKDVKKEDTKDTKPVIDEPICDTEKLAKKIDSSKETLEKTMTDSILNEAEVTKKSKEPVTETDGKDQKQSKDSLEKDEEKVIKEAQKTDKPVKEETKDTKKVEDVKEVPLPPETAKKEDVAVAMKEDVSKPEKLPKDEKVPLPSDTKDTKESATIEPTKDATKSVEKDNKEVKDKDTKEITKESKEVTDLKSKDDDKVTHADSKTEESVKVPTETTSLDSKETAAIIGETVEPSKVTDIKDHSKDSETTRKGIEEEMMKETKVVLEAKPVKEEKTSVEDGKEAMEKNTADSEVSGSYPDLSKEVQSLLDDITKTDEETAVQEDKKLEEKEKLKTEGLKKVEEEIIVKKTAKDEASDETKESEEKQLKTEDIKDDKQPKEEVALVEDIKEFKESILKETEKQIEDAKEKLKDIKDDTASKIEDAKKEITEKTSFFGGIVKDIGATLVKDVSNIVEGAQKEILDIKDMATSRIDETKEDIAAKKELVVNVAQEIEKQLIEDATHAVDSVVKETSEEKEKLIEAAKDFKETVVREGTTISEKATAEIEATKTVVESAVHDVKETVAEQKATLEGVVTDFGRTVTKGVTDTVDEVKKEVSNAQDQAKAQVGDIGEKAVEKIDEKITEIKKEMHADKEVVDDSKKVLDDTKKKLSQQIASQIEDIDKKSETVIKEIDAKGDSLKTSVDTEGKALQDKFAQKREEVGEKLEDLAQDSVQMGSDLKDSVKDISEVPFVKKNASQISAKPEDKDTESQYALHNGLEAVEKMVVDVLTADRQEIDTKVIDQKDVTSTIEKVEEDIENIVEKGISEIKDFVEDTKEVISSVFKDDSHNEEKEEILEKAAQDIEENYNIVADMAKSVIFEKCDKSDKMSDEEREKDEKVLEKSAKGIESEYQTVSDMAKSIAFEKCEKPLSEKKKEEKHWEEAAHDIEKNYQTVSDMAKSIVFEKCDSTSKDKEETEEKDESKAVKGEATKEKLTELKDDSKKKDEKEIVKDIKDATPDAKKESIKDDQEDKKAGLTKSSGRSSPEKIEVKDTVDDAAAKLSGKSSPAPSCDLKDATKESSGKSTPDIKDSSHIKVDNQDSLLSGKSSPGLSGKSSPLLSDTFPPATKTESKDSLLSGKSSPVLSGELKEQPKESLSGKSTPDATKQDSEEPSSKTDSEKECDKENTETSTDATINIKEKSEDKISGTSTPDLKESKPSGKSTPDSKRLESEDRISGKSTPDSKAKQSEDGVSGRSTPDSKIKESESVKKVKKDIEQAAEVVKESVTKVEKKDEKESKTTESATEDKKKTEKQDKLDDTSKAKQEEQKKEQSTPEDKEIKGKEAKTDSEKDAKTSLGLKETTEKKLSISDVQITVNFPEKEKTKISSPDESKFEEKTESKDVDSIDSGIGTEVDSKGKKPEEPEIKVTEAKEESIAGPSTTSLSPTKSSEDLHLSGKSTPDIAEVEKIKEMQETLKHEKHIPGSSTPPTVPVSPIVKEISTTQSEDTKTTPAKSSTVTSIKDNDIRSCTPGSDDYEIGASTYSDISSGQVSRAPHLLESERIESDEDDDVPGSPMSVTSQVAHSRSSSRYDFEDDRIGTKMDPMNTSFYGALPDEAESELDFEKAMVEHREARGGDLVTSAEESASYLYEITKAKYSSPEPELSGQTQLDQLNKNGAGNLMTQSFVGDLPTTTTTETKKDPFDSWGKPLGLPSPAPPNDNRGTPKKERKLPSNVSAKNKLNDDKKRSESPSKYKNKKINPIYVDLTYVPHHGNAYYSYVDFFKRVRARYYVFSGIEPSREVYSALLEAKQTWEDKELEVTIIPTYDTDILGYWVAENEELLTKYKIDLSPSASRCTINLQDHETSCSAYRLEF